MTRKNLDWKAAVIVVMALLLVGIGSWIGYTFYQAKQQNFAFQNQQLGRLAGQQEVLNSIQTTGYFAFNVANQDGVQQQVVLLGQLTTPGQLQQLNQQRGQRQQGQ